MGGVGQTGRSGGAGPHRTGEQRGRWPGGLSPPGLLGGQGYRLSGHPPLPRRRQTGPGMPTGCGHGGSTQRCRSGYPPGLAGQRPPGDRRRAGHREASAHGRADGRGLLPPGPGESPAPIPTHPGPGPPLGPRPRHRRGGPLHPLRRYHGNPGLPQGGPLLLPRSGAGGALGGGGHRHPGAPGRGYSSGGVRRLMGTPDPAAPPPLRPQGHLRTGAGDSGLPALHRRRLPSVYGVGTGRSRVCYPGLPGEHPPHSGQQVDGGYPPPPAGGDQRCLRPRCGARGAPCRGAI
ncbi:hypothetical protein HRbin23_01266 [bacterium HR23]|nr:hypothetical protein HRbin23_01266 [bacterium HR23]